MFGLLKTSRSAGIAAPWNSRSAISRIFRTTGGFQTWQGNVQVNDADIPKSAVEVTVQTGSLKMMDRQQADMLKDSDFFDVDRFPQMTFRSDKIERTGEETLKIDGFLTLRGVTRPMTLDVTLTDRKPNAAPGARYARVRAKERSSDRISA